MALGGLTQYVVFRRNLGSHGRTPPNPLSHKEFLRTTGIAVVVVVAVVIAFVVGLITLANLSQVTTGILIVASIGYFAVMLRSPRVEPLERTRVRAFIPLFIANAVFWSLFQQIFTVLAVYSDERMNWSIFGWRAPSNWIGSIEPVWIILLSPLFATMWTRLGRRAPHHASSPMASSVWARRSCCSCRWPGRPGAAFRRWPLRRSWRSSRSPS